MSGRIITLFGEEIVPDQQPKEAPKPRAKKKAEENTIPPAEEEKTEVTPVVAAAEEVGAEPATPARKKRELEKEMVLPDDWKGEKQYYAIGEVADLFKVKTSHIRFWTNEFKLKVRTTRKGDRLYTAEQIRELKAIHHLVKERGFTLTGAKAKLKSQNKRDVETIDLKTSLLELRNKLVVIKNQIA